MSLFACCRCSETIGNIDVEERLMRHPDATIQMVPHFRMAFAKARPPGMTQSWGSHGRHGNKKSCTRQLQFTVVKCGAAILTTPHSNDS